MSFRPVFAGFSAVLLSLTVTLWASPSMACGGLFASAQDPKLSVSTSGLQVLFVQHPKSVTTHVRIAYTGDAKEFVWLLPVPHKPKVGVGFDAIFEQLLRRTTPMLSLQSASGFENEDWRKGFCDNAVHCLTWDWALEEAPYPVKSGGETPAQPVVLERKAVGPFQTVVLAASDAEGALQWLNDYGYRAPAAAKEGLQHYLGHGMKLLAVRLKAGKSADDIVPLRIEVPGGTPMLPLRMSRISAGGPLPIVVWLLGRYRALPKNQLHVTADFEGLDWARPHRNYKDVVAQAVAAAGGKAWLTEYAHWHYKFMEKTSDEPEGNFFFYPQFITPYDSIRYLLSGQRDFVQDVRPRGLCEDLVMQLGYFTPQTQSLLRAIAPRPKAMQDLSDDELDKCRWCAFCTDKVCTEFWGHIDKEIGKGPHVLAPLQEALFPTLLDLDASFKWVEGSRNELEAQLVELGAAIKDKKGEPTLPAWTVTRLYTVQQPAQLDDVMFAYNPHLPRVDARLVRDGEVFCDEEGEPWLELPCAEGKVALTIARTEEKCMKDHPIPGLAKGGLGVLPNCRPPKHRIEVLDEYGLPRVIDPQDIGKVQAALAKVIPGKPSLDEALIAELKVVEQPKAESWQRWPDPLPEVKKPDVQPENPGDPQGCGAASGRSKSPLGLLWAMGLSLAAVLVARRRARG